MDLGKETEFVEFKKSTSELKQGIISLASMLNKNGIGTLYFGVKNNGEIIGQIIGEETTRDISHAIGDNIRPQIIPTISVVTRQDKSIIKVEVSGKEKPYSAYGRYYMRTADEDRELAPNKLIELAKRANNNDIILEIPSRKQELSFNDLKEHFKRIDFHLNDINFEKNLDLFTEDGKYNLMAELLADKNDISIKVVVFKGKDKMEIIRRNEYGFQCLVTAMNTALDYVNSLNDTKVILTTHARIEEDLFDFNVLKEAWQNACLHTKWERHNPPAIYVFSDRIEIISTGGLVSELSERDFFGGVSRPVNERLQKIFGQLGLVEQTGHGVTLITEKYGKKSIEIMENFVNVIIPFSRPRLSLADGKTQIETIEKALSDSQLKVLNVITNNPNITIKEISSVSNVTERQVKNIIKYLTEIGYIERVGSNKTGYWHVK